MKKALIVGFAVVVWLPFVYRELNREPARAPERDLDADTRTAEELLEQIDGLPAVPPPEHIEEPEEPEEELEADEDSDDEEPPGPEAREPGTEPSEPGEVDESAEAPAVDEDGEPTEPEAPPFELRPSGPAQALARAFDQESRDALWASDREASLRGVLAEAGLPGDEVDAIRCQRAVCKIEMHLTPASNALYPDAFKALHEQFGAEFGVVPQPVEDEAERDVHLFVMRKGYKLADLHE